MPTDTSHQQVHSLKEARTFLKQKLERLQEILPSEGRAEATLRLTIRVEPQDILAWLSCQRSSRKLFWSQRNEPFQLAGVGVSHEIEWRSAVNHESVITKLRAGIDPQEPYSRYYGGICFDENNLTAEWFNFGPCRFFMPRFELFSNGEGCFLACNLYKSSDWETTLAAAHRELHELSDDVHPVPVKFPAPVSREDQPAKEQWTYNVESILDAVRKKRFGKVVVARRSVFAFEQPVNAFGLLDRLRQNATDCYVFAFQFKADEVFVGASPEQLYRREGTNVSSEAVAGTRRRGGGSTEDERLKTELCGSGKDLSEHSFVVEMLEHTLQKLCVQVKQDSRPEILTLNGGHHLITRFTGKLGKDVNDGTILSLLHPTPAVAGSPTAQAMTEIAKLEPFSRGWYAGPVGYLGLDRSEFAVAIRSGLIKDRTVQLYAGAGIVNGSLPHDEWNEVEDKLNGFLTLFPNESANIS